LVKAHADGGVLAGQADALADVLGLLGDVEADDGRGASIA
jgi:hypothetical protein